MPKYQFFNVTDMNTDTSEWETVRSLGTQLSSWDKFPS